MKRALWIGMIASLVLTSAGCRNPCYRGPGWCAAPSPPRPVFVSPPPPAVLQTQAPAFPTVPPTTFGTPQPGPSQGPSPGPGVIPPPPPNAAPSIPNVPPVRSQSQWQPSDTREPTSPRDVPPGIRLYAPEPADKEPETAPKKLPAQATLPPIADFTTVSANQAYAGRRPPLDGLDWLQAKGVKTVVHVRAAGEDDSTDRKQVEARTMRYIAFEISPATLTRERVDDFIRLVRDGQVYVYDRDGSLAGSMWYLYFRLGEMQNDDAAQLRALPLGLQPSGIGQHRDMWHAVQTLLSQGKR